MDQNRELERLVEQTIRTLYDKGIAAIDLAPLVKLHDAVKSMNAPDRPAPAPVSQRVDCDPLADPEAAAVPPAQPAPPDAGATWAGNVEENGIYDRDGRRGEMRASEDLMARASAIVDLLVHSGDSPEHACQVITRQLLSVGIQLPESGGDARAWKRLMNWRNALIHYKRSGRAWDVYCAFKEQLAHIPPEKRIQTAVGERLWDQRQLEFAARNIA